MIHSSRPAFPDMTPNNSFSFYPYQLGSRTQTHNGIRGLAPLTQSISQHDTRPVMGGPGPSTEHIARETKARKRAEKRALMGRRPVGVGLSREAEELSEEENSLEDEKQNINMFGHRFLLPYGRRLTQMEMDAAPSPTPSEADQERRQEDRDAVSPSSALVGQQVQEEEEGDAGGEEVDLDASMEDMDADNDASMEGGEGPSELEEEEEDGADEVEAH